MLCLFVNKCQFKDSLTYKTIDIARTGTHLTAQMKKNNSLNIKDYLSAKKRLCDMTKLHKKQVSNASFWKKKIF